MITFRTLFFFSLSGVLLALCITGCEKADRQNIVDYENHPIYKDYKFSDDEKVIDIGVPTPWAAVSHVVEVMKRDEVFKEQLREKGYTVRFHPFLKGGDINYFMRKGRLKGSITGDMPTLILASEGHIKVVSVFHKGSVSLISRDIYRMKDLKGKRVAYPSISIGHYYLLRLLQDNGLSMDAVKQRPMDTNQMLAAMKNGEIDAFTTFEPTARIYTMYDPTLHAISRSFSSYGFFNINREYGERHKDAVKSVIAAQLRAIMWLKESNTNLRRASLWVAGDASRLVPLSFDKYVRELNTICYEDLAGDMNAYYSAVIGEEVMGDRSDIRNKFEFLKEKGFIEKNKSWAEVKGYFDAGAVREVIKGMKVGPAKVLNED